MARRLWSQTRLMEQSGSSNAFRLLPKRSEELCGPMHSIATSAATPWETRRRKYTKLSDLHEPGRLRPEISVCYSITFPYHISRKCLHKLQHKVSFVIRYLSASCDKGRM